MKKIIFWFCFLLGAQNTSIPIFPLHTGLNIGYFLVVEQTISIVTSTTKNEYGPPCSGFLDVHQNGLDKTSIIDYNYTQTTEGFKVQFIQVPAVGDLIKIRCFRGWK